MSYFGTDPVVTTIIIVAIMVGVGFAMMLANMFYMSRKLRNISEQTTQPLRVVICDLNTDKLVVFRQINTSVKPSRDDGTDPDLRAVRTGATGPHSHIPSTAMATPPPLPRERSEPVGVRASSYIEYRQRADNELRSFGDRRRYSASDAARIAETTATLRVSDIRGRQ